jgi:putative ABC transport system permease protein
MQADKMKYLFRIAFRNVMANFKHSLAALISIAAAFLAIVIFDGYVSHIRSIYVGSYKYRGMFGDLILENKNVRTPMGKSDPWSFSINHEQQAVIDQFMQTNNDQVVASMKNLTLMGSITNGGTSSVFLARAHDVEAGLKMRLEKSDIWGWNVLYGEPFNNSTNPEKILIGQTLGHILGCDPVTKERVITPEGAYRKGLRPFTCKQEQVQLSLSTESGQLNAINFKPIGLVDAGYRDMDARYVMLPLDMGQKLANTDKVSFYTISLKAAKLLPTFIERFNSEVGSRYPDLKIQPWQTHEIGDLFRKTIDLLLVFKNFVIVVIVFISSLSIFSTFVKNVKERTREIGLLLSLGFYRSQVLAIFLMESALLSLLGIAAGATFGLVLATFINNFHIYYRAGLLSEPVIFQVGFNPTSILVSAVGLVLIAVFSCYLSVSTTTRRKIVDCLQDA